VNIGDRRYGFSDLAVRLSMFKSVKRPYVFTIVLLSYPMYLHDFSRFSPNIRFCRLVDYILAEEGLSSERLDLKHFRGSAVA
jgi:hypothetical protein